MIDPFYHATGIKHQKPRRTGFEHSIDFLNDIAHDIQLLDGTGRYARFVDDENTAPAMLFYLPGTYMADKIAGCSCHHIASFTMNDIYSFSQLFYDFPARTGQPPFKVTGSAIPVYGSSFFIYQYEDTVHCIGNRHKIFTG